MDKKIPFATRERYPEYLRALRYYQNKGHDKIMSNELARELGINSTSVRRDISYLGHMGRQGYGYDIKKLIDELKKELGDGKDEGIVLMGVGNMGKALLKYNTLSFQVGTIVCGFDVDPNNIGIIENVPVYHYKDLHTKFPKGVKMAILALPGNIAQSVADELMALGVTAFINFSDGALKTRRRVIVESVDLATIVQEVIYKFKQVNG